MKVMSEIIEESKTIDPYVIIAQPRRDEKETPAQFLDGALNLDVDFAGYSHAFISISGEKVDVARNYLIETAIATNAKYLLFVGEDTVLPYDGFLKLHETAENNPNSVVSGVYYIKLSSPMVMIKKNNAIIPADVLSGEEIHNVHLIGMDAMLIPIEILKKMKEEDPEIPFCCIYSDDSIPGGFIGEDNFFTYRLRKMGIDIICNTNVQCLHVDLLSNKYTASPNIDINKYFTINPLGERLTFADKRIIDKRYIDRIPVGSYKDKN